MMLPIVEKAEGRLWHGSANLTDALAPCKADNFDPCSILPNNPPNRTLFGGDLTMSSGVHLQDGTDLRLQYRTAQFR